MIIIIIIIIIIIVTITTTATTTTQSLARCHEVPDWRPAGDSRVSWPGWGL